MSIMSFVPGEIFRVLQEVTHRAKGENNIAKIILYGSYSKGNYNDESDVDIAFFIDLNSENIRSVYNSVYRICSQYSVDIQPQVFSDTELLQPIGIIEEVVRFGVDITDI